MTIRTRIAAAGAAVALAGAGAVLLPAVASAHSTTHTLKFTAVTLKGANFSKTDGGTAEQDVNSAGKTIGFDVTNFGFNPTTKAKSLNVALSTNGGILYGALKPSNSATIKGTVTGGTGTFQGATGTIVAKQLNKAGTKTAVTITYSN
jgi:hypothetical protein